MNEIETLYEDVDMGKALDTLLQNRNFKKVILDGYISGGSEMLVKNLVKIPTDQRSIVMERMIGISRFNQHLESIVERAENAKETLAQYNEIDSEVDNVL
jgi:hypothetical protein